MRGKLVTYLRDSVTFFGGFLRHPLATGGLLPSSRALAEALIRLGPIGRGDFVVEFGPGTGSCTAPILEQIGPEGKFVGFETNEVFVKLLRERFPQALIIHDGAQKADEHFRRLGLEPADVVISGLPFGTIPVPVSRRVIQAARAILKPGGTFLSFQYCLSAPFPRTRRFRSMLAETFAGYRLRPVWLNVPPALVVQARKNGDRP